MAAPADSYQAQQAVLAGALAVQVAAAWHALLDVSHLGRTIPYLSAGVASLVARYGQAAALLAAEYYAAARLEAGVAGRFTAVPAVPAGPDAVEAAVRWAVRGLWSAQPDIAPARAATAAAAEKLTLDAGRSTVLGAVEKDRKARGWARVTRPGCCYFCAMLATRGAVYKSRGAASFEAHDHDHCHPEPVFTAYEPSAQVREWQALYRTAARGKSGAEARRAFRQHFEGRAE